VAHIYNPSYSGGRDQESHGLKPSQGKQFTRLSQKNPTQERACGVAQGANPKFKSQHQQKKKKKNSVIS
jgi:hypothetical protein